MLAAAVAALVGAVALTYNTVGLEEGTVMADFLELQPRGQATFWKDAGFRNQALTMSLNGGFTDINVGDHMCNDCISSFQIGAGVRAHICKHAYCKDDHVWDNAIDIVGPYNEGKISDINDWISHIRLYPYDPETQPLVQVFNQRVFGTGHAGLFDVGDYTNED